MATYFYDKKFINSQIASMYRCGGHYQRAAEKVKSILYDINNKVENPFHGVNSTNHGETRIENCIKYDLNGFARLITIQSNGAVIIQFFGKHEECQRWLDNNKGKKITYDPEKQVIVDVFETENISNPEQRRTVDSDYTSSLLYKKLGDFYFNKINHLISGQEILPFLGIDSTVDEDDLIGYCQAIEKPELQSLYLDVFLSLIQGDVDGAKNRINYYFDNLVILSKINEAEVMQILSNEKYIKSSDLDPEILDFIVRKATWQEFMLFLHPAQREFVDKDFKGVARLLGVSGSGKTSVLVHRAVRLAEKYSGEKILIITLNSALSKLLESLIEELLSFKCKTHLRSQIVVRSYWKLCRDKLLEFKKTEPLINRKYESVGYKDGNIKQIWSEFYLYQQDSYTAEDIFPIHQSLLSRGINPRKYIREEFDWVRSAYNKRERNNYLENEREGRFVPFNTEYREMILEGISKWEEKMNFVGISDYMNLTTELNPFIENIEPEYRCVLVDEIQDFGTTELQIIRRLAKDDDNSFFFSGDLAQQVYAKNHKIRNAGFNILPEGYIQIFKNYRNSREILDAAYNMFSSNVSIEQIESEDFKILKPEYANFSSTKPFIRKSTSLESEVNYALNYLKSLDSEGKKSCIAICGLGYFSINKLGHDLGITVLDGTLDINKGSIFISDLEQTKGFEFDRMVILNVRKDVFPNPTLPQEEVYRDICKLYVTMTRAKKELIISYSGELSNVFGQKDELYTYDNWEEHVEATNFQIAQIDVSDDTATSKTDLRLMGKEFILSQVHLELSKPLQDKIISTITGKSVTGIRELEWKTVSDLFRDIEIPRNFIPIRNLFGPTTYEELVALKKKLVRN